MTDNFTKLKQFDDLYIKYLQAHIKLLDAMCEIFVDTIKELESK